MANGEQFTRCGHPNVFGCPNHGGDARAWLRTRILQVKLGLRKPFLADVEQWPCGYRITDKGRAYLSAAEAWRQ